MPDVFTHSGHLAQLRREIEAVSEWLDLQGVSLTAEDEGERVAAAELAEERRRSIFGDSLERGLAAVKSYRDLVARRVAARRGELAEIERQIREPLKRDEALLRSLDEQVGGILEAAGRRRVDDEMVVVSLRKNPPAVELDPEVEACPDLLPLGCYRTKIEPDKAEIKRRLREGQEVPGARYAGETRRVEWR